MNSLVLTAAFTSLLFTGHAFANEDESSTCSTVLESAEKAISIALSSQAAIARIDEDIDIVESGVERADESAKSLNNRIDEVLNKIFTMYQPPSRNWSSYSAHRGGGANAMNMTLQCAENQVVAGLEVVVAGTCRGHCDPDGGTIHKFRLLCEPRHN